ncbi:MAG: cytochrome b/b6 domain-containing protein [Alphaproteobacteria bacterium]|nr:cytochrome b/b6 domain-containing protein [Alphaproteobacteria bacterium]
MAKLRHLLMEADTYQASAHGRVECRTCHGAGCVQFPHAADSRSQISPCDECHAPKVMRIEDQYSQSVHAAKEGTEQDDKFTCVSCHDPHIYNVAANIGTPKAIVAQDNRMCLNCHEDSARFMSMARPGEMLFDLDAGHKWLPNTRLHWQSVRCVECHTPLAKTISHEILGKEKAEQNCVTCHTRDTALRKRLYSHLAQTEHEAMGFTNSIILANSYVIGATGNSNIDLAIFVMMAAVVTAVLGHGVIRLFVVIRRPVESCANSFICTAFIYCRCDPALHFRASSKVDAVGSRIYLLPLWLRLWHWTNALIILTLAVSGLSLHFADPALMLLPFALADKVHSVGGLALVALYLFFVVAKIVSGTWRQYVPKSPGILHRCWVQARFYCVGIFNGESHPYPSTLQTRFNDIQALSYLVIMYMAVPILIVSGLVYLYPQFAPIKFMGMDGLLPVAMVHYLAGSAIVLFAIAHIYLGTTGSKITSLFKMMVTGWHEH